MKRSYFLLAIALVTTLIIVPVTNASLFQNEIATLIPNAGVEIPASSKIESDKAVNASVINTSKINSVISKSGFSCAHGDLARIVFLANTNIEMKSRAQNAKAKVHFQGAGKSERQLSTGWDPWRLKIKQQKQSVRRPISRIVLRLRTDERKDCFQTGHLIS